MHTYDGHDIFSAWTGGCPRQTYIFLQVYIMYYSKYNEFIVFDAVQEHFPPNITLLFFPQKVGNSGNSYSKFGLWPGQRVLQQIN
jgi:hypothetical protein